MFRITFFFLFFFLSTQLSSQPGFKQLYNIEERGTAFHNMILKGDTLVAVGIHFSDEAIPRQGILFAKLDTLGNLLDYTIHLDSLGDDYLLDNNYDFILLSDGGYALVGGTFSRRTGFLMKFNTQGNQVFVREYTDTNARSTHHTNLIELENGYIIAGTKQQLDYSLNIFALRIDSLGNKLWETSYGNPIETDILGSILKINNDVFVLGGIRSSKAGLPIEDRWSQSRIFAIDGQGNILWNWEADTNTETGIVGLNATPDGGWIYCSNENEISEYNDFNTFPKIVKRDSDMNLEWEKLVDVSWLTFNTYIDLKPNMDTSAWIGIGNWGPELDGEVWGGSCIYKISPEGEEVWTRCDTVPWSEPTNSREYYGGMVVLPSGSVIAAGRSDKSFPHPRQSFGWLVKTDKNGCIDTLCNLNTAIIEQFAGEAIKAFPNPAYDELTIDFGDQVYQSAEIVGFNAIGAQILSKQLAHFQSKISLDISSVPSGLLFLQVKLDGFGGKVIKVFRH